MRRSIQISAAVILATCAAALALWQWDAPRNRIELLLERGTIEQRARAYLNAEMEHNNKQVYAYLAPSSTYRKTHSYEQFIQDVNGTAVKIKSYKIVDIYRLRDNDTNEYLAVSRFVQVEVAVDIAFEDTGLQSTCNYCFTFLKEGGTWYKG